MAAALNLSKGKLSLQRRGIYLLFLLCGNEVANVCNAVRVSIQAQELNEEAETLFQAAKEFNEVINEKLQVISKEQDKERSQGVPACHLSPMCGPAEFCHWSERFEGGYACQHKWRYKSDDKLSQRFGKASIQIVEASKQFASDGNLKILAQQRRNFETTARCSAVVQSTTPPPDLLTKLQSSFQEVSYNDFQSLLKTMKAPINAHKNATEDNRPGGQILKENIRKGIAKNEERISENTIKALENLLDNPPAQPAGFKSTLDDVVSTMGNTRLKKAVAKAVAEGTAQFEECTSNNNCEDALETRLNELEAEEIQPGNSSLIELQQDSTQDDLRSAGADAAFAASMIYVIVMAVMLATIPVVGQIMLLVFMGLLALVLLGVSVAFVFS